MPFNTINGTSIARVAIKDYETS